MLDAVIRISSIDYENTFRSIFPALSEKIASKDYDNMILLLFREMGDAAVPVLIDLLQRLSGETKDELLISAVNAYAPTLKDKLNRELQKDKWGSCFRIGAVSAEKKNDILLNISQIEVKYQELLKNDKLGRAADQHLGLLSRPVRSVASLASVIAPDTTEKIGLDLLLQKENEKKLTELLRSLIVKHGIMIGVDEISVMQSDRRAENVIEADPTFRLSKKTEKEIITALAGYLRESTENRLQQS